MQIQSISLIFECNCIRHKSSNFKTWLPLELQVTEITPTQKFDQQQLILQQLIILNKMNFLNLIFKKRFTTTNGMVPTVPTVPTVSFLGMPIVGMPIRRMPNQGMPIRGMPKTLMSTTFDFILIIVLIICTLVLIINLAIIISLKNNCIVNYLIDFVSKSSMDIFYQHQNARIKTNVFNV